MKQAVRVRNENLKKRDYRNAFIWVAILEGFVLQVIDIKQYEILKGKQEHEFAGRKVEVRV